ncbi:MAG: ABC transporter substrate-binding protein [Devosia sp.]
MHTIPFRQLRLGRRILRTLAAVSLGLAFASAGAPSLAQAMKDGGTLRAALTGEPDMLDPAVSTIYTGAQVYEGIFSKLIDFDAAGNFVPDLASSWEQVDDKTWKFNLVTNATFHNGEKFTAADVKYSFERILDPATASAYAGLYAQIESVDAKDPAVAVFHLKSSFGPFLNNLATNGQIVNQKAIESGDPARNPVGTGPFKFVEWVQGDHLTLEKNPSYFKTGLPHLDGVVFRFLLVDQSRIDALSAGELDWADAIPLPQVPTLSKDPRFTYITSPVAGIADYIALNTSLPPFDNVKVRQAVALAINRADIRDAAYAGTGELGKIEMPTGSPWYDEESIFAGVVDIEKAKALLAEAGYANGLTVEYLGLPQYPELLKTGQVIREHLKVIGIDMQIKPVDVSIWYDAFVNSTYQITSAYQERSIDPDNFYSLVIKTGGPVNTVKYSNADVDALIDKAAAIVDMAERKDIYRQIRAKVTEDAPLVFAHYETVNYLMNKNVIGSAITPTLSLHMENIGFAQ